MSTLEDMRDRFAGEGIEDDSLEVFAAVERMGPRLLGIESLYIDLAYPRRSMPGSALQFVLVRAALGTAEEMITRLPIPPRTFEDYPGTVISVVHETRVVRMIAGLHAMLLTFEEAKGSLHITEDNAIRQLRARNLIANAAGDRGRPEEPR